MSLIQCAKCKEEFEWGQAYWQQKTPGSHKHHPPGHGDYRPRVFCPHCGYMIADWDIDYHEDKDRWVWYGKNKKVNENADLPPNPLSLWGHEIPPRAVVEFSKERVDLEDLKGYLGSGSEQDESKDEVASAMEMIPGLDTQTATLDSAIFFAATQGINEAVEILLDAGAHPNYKAPTGWTPLLQAASEGHAEIVRMLLEAGADPNDQNVFAAHTPLILGSLNNHPDVVKVLLEYEVDVSLQNQFGRSAKGCARGEVMKILDEIKESETK